MAESMRRMRMALLDYNLTLRRWFRWKQFYESPKARSVVLVCELNIYTKSRPFYFGMRMNHVIRKTYR